MKAYFLTFIFAVLFLFLTNCATASLITETEPNDTRATAQNLDGFFSLDPVDHNQNGICDIQECNTIPHVTVEAVGDGTLDYFSFYYKAGSRLIIDIDYNDSTIWLAAFEADTGYLIFDAPFRPEGASTNPDTIDTPDDFSVGILNNSPYQKSGRIIIGIAAADHGYSFPWPGDNGGYDDGPYYLHVSLENSAPVPVPPTILLMGSGLIGIGTFFRKKKRKGAETG